MLALLCYCDVLFVSLRVASHAEDIGEVVTVKALRIRVGVYAILDPDFLGAIRDNFFYHFQNLY